MLLTWDPDKAAANLDKHGVDFRDAATVFTDTLSATFPSENHSESEARFLTIGESTKGELLVVAHTEEDDINPSHQRSTSDPTGKTLL